jgi:hypothetical protein
MANAMMVPYNAPSYQCYSTDIVGGKVSNASYKGADLYLIDLCAWYRVLDDLTLAPLVYNISSGVSGSASGSNIGTAGGISLAASEAHIGQIGGTGYIVSASFTGNNSAILHGVNSAITPLAGGLVEIPNAVRVNGGSAYIMDITLTTSGSSTTITPKLHFSSSSNIIVAPDSGSWVDIFADDVYKLGIYTLPAMVKASGSATDCTRSTSTDTSVTTHPAILVSAQAGSRSIYAGIETTTAFTPSASQVWRIKLRMDQN